MKAIYKREVAAYFHSMTGYVFIAFLLLMNGIYFMVYNLVQGQPRYSYTLSSAVLIFLLAVPLLTMRSLAEERHAKTDQLLLTSPVNLWGIVVGKFFAMVTVYAVPVLVSCLCPLIIKLNGTAYLGSDYASILAFFLLGCVYIAIGLFISALTESQIIAAVGTFGVLLLLFLWDGLVGYLPTTAVGSLLGFGVLLILLCFLVSSLSNNYKVTVGVLAVGLAVLFGFYIKDSTAFAGLLPTVLGKFSLNKVFSNFAGYQVFDLAGLILYLSLTALMLFLTVQVLQRRRWN